MTGLSSRRGAWPELTDLADLIAAVGPWLWLLPQAVLRPAGPVLLMQAAHRVLLKSHLYELRLILSRPLSSPGSCLPCRSTFSRLTSNLLKTPAPIPSTHLDMLPAVSISISNFATAWLISRCIQEARSKAGRWDTAGILTWRSGSQHGQYSCEVWIRPDAISPALTLKDFRVLSSTPRCLVLTCIRPDFPITVCSAHGPHADRPDIEAEHFWRDLREALGHISPNKCLVVGVDANADFFAADEHNMLIGSLLARSEPTRNDTMLFETCLNLGLKAPATFDHLQRGPTWSWEHTSGKRKAARSSPLPARTTGT